MVKVISVPYLCMGLDFQENYTQNSNSCQIKDFKLRTKVEGLKGYIGQQSKYSYTSSQKIESELQILSHYIH